MNSNIKQTEPLLNPKVWVKTYADYLFAFAKQRINDDELARDLVQDTFLAALEKKDSFKGLSAERTWLVAILKYKIIDVYRKKAGGKHVNVDNLRSEVKIDSFFEENGHWQTAHQPKEFTVNDTDFLEKKEFDLIFKKCLEKLPALWLSVFKMKHLDEEDSQNICTDLQISSANFWVIMHRAKLSLRSCLEKNWDK